MSRRYGYALRNVVHQQLVGVLSQVLLEGARQLQHRLAGAQLRTLHHALLVVDEQVGAARQDVTRLVAPEPGYALPTHVRHEPLDQLREVTVSATGTAGLL